MTLAIDFDAVIHGYSRGWHDGTIYDPPLPGAIAGLRALMEQDAVYIHTSREPEQVMPWLEAHGLDVTIDERCGTCLGDGGGQQLDADDRPAGAAWTCDACKGYGLLTFWDVRGQLLVTNRKLPALVYVDDRALRFETWEQTLAVLRSPDTTRPQAGGDARPFTELRDSGILWLVNRVALHPRRLALALHVDEDSQPYGWSLVKSADREPWTFDVDTDNQGYQRAEATIAVALGHGPRLLACGLCYEELAEEVHPHPECPIGRRASKDRRTHLVRDQLVEPAKMDTTVPCCVCGGGPVVYDNYQGQVFCWRCADCDCGRDGPCLRTGLHRPAAGVCTATWQHPHRGLIPCEDEAEHYTSDYCIHRGHTPDGAPMQWRDGDKGSTPHRPDAIRTVSADASVLNPDAVQTSGSVPTPSETDGIGRALTCPDSIRTSPDADASGYPEARRAQIRAAIDTAFGDGRCSCGQTTPLLGSTAGGYHFHLTREDHDRLVRQREGVDGWHPAVDAWGQCWVRTQEAENRADRAEKAYDALRTDVYTAARYIQVQSTSRLGRHSRRRILSVLPAWIKEHGPLTPITPEQQ